MPVTSCQIDGKSGYKWGDAGKCYPHNGSETSKKSAKKKAIAQGIAIGDMKMSIMFDNTIPSDVVKRFINDGYRVHIWGGEGLFSKTKPAFKLAKDSGANPQYIHWGKAKFVLESNDIDMFMTSNDIYKDMDGYVGYVVNDKIDLKATPMNFRRVLYEKWVTQSSLTKGGESCPICLTLSKMDWVEVGQPVEYIWPGGIKSLRFGLPPYRQAHSDVGEGSWKVDDSVCKCYKEFKSEIIDEQQFSNIKPLVVEIKHTCNGKD